jgi:endonuclease YncB( thermonuclease family)
MRRAANPGRAAAWRGVLFVVAAALGAWALQRGDADWVPERWLPRPRGPVCDVERVLDGDSLRLLCAEGPIEVRLHCIDAPERGQRPWSTQSRRHLQELAQGQVEPVVVEQDRFGRQVADVYGTEPGRPLLNLEQVRSGYAAVYRRYCRDPRYERAEREARDLGRGIWSRSGEHQTPWTYRLRSTP